MLAVLELVEKIELRVKPELLGPQKQSVLIALMHPENHKLLQKFLVYAEVREYVEVAAIAVEVKIPIKVKVESCLATAKGKHIFELFELYAVS